MKRFSKKGSEKPIEIFVALFLILAVAMVLLRMFSGQISDATSDLGQFQDRQAALAKCEGVCSAAKSNNCRLEDMVRYCGTHFTLDLDGDNRIGLNEEFPFFLCEDRIYCPLVDNCVCGRDLTMQNCAEILTEYYGTLGFNDDQTTAQLERIFVFTDGACTEDDAENELAWTNLFVFNN